MARQSIGVQPILDPVARQNGAVTDGIRNLDDEVRAATHGHPQAQVIAQKGNVLDAGLKPVAVQLRLGGEADPFRTDGQGDRVTWFTRPDLEGLDDLVTDLYPRNIVLKAEDPSVQQIIFTDEAGNERAFRLFVQRFRLGDLLNPAAAKDGHPVRQHHGLLLVMGDVDDRDPQAALDAPDLILHFLTQTAVKGAERFVHQHQAGFKHQRPGDGHALLLAAGQLGRTPLLKSFQAHELQRAPDALSDLLRVEPAYFERKRQVAANRHMRKQRVVLKNHADAALARRQVMH